MSDSKMFDKYLYIFRPFGSPEGLIEDKIYSHHMIALESITQEAIEHERERHRDSVGNLVTLALYEGYLPMKVEWWEGEFDDDWALREYRFFEGAGKDFYHFWTRITVASSPAYPLVKRNPGHSPSFFSFRGKIPNVR